MNIKIEKLKYKVVFNLNQGVFLKKGSGKNNKDILNKCSNITTPYLCYYWKTESSILYVGSISADYQKKLQHQTNLSKRVQNYLQNHAFNVLKNSSNTNLRIFNAINEQLKYSSVEFGIFQFDSLCMNERQYKYDDFSKNPYLVYMFEHILIADYKEKNQCNLNK
jgi:hypothetical protein